MTGPLKEKLTGQGYICESRRACVLCACVLVSKTKKHHGYSQPTPPNVPPAEIRD